MFKMSALEKVRIQYMLASYSSLGGTVFGAVCLALTPTGVVCDLSIDSSSGTTHF